MVQWNIHWKHIFCFDGWALTLFVLTSCRFLHFRKYNSGVDVTAGPWPVYLRWGQSNWAKIGPLGQLIFSGHLGQQLSFLPCHSISTDNRLMKFPDKTLKFNFNHSLKAINSLITQSACVYLDLLPHVKRIWREIYAGNQYFIIQ